VLLDGRPAGTTPLAEPLETTAGEHRLTLRNPYFPALEKTVRFAPGSSELAVDLEREFALVDLQVVPWAVVFIDGALVDTTPIGRPIALAPGEHVIELRHPELGRRTERVKLDSAGPYRLAYAMGGR
jgi:hypothetical protein